jgi:tRNA(Ile)-lysidine synthase
LSIAPDSPTWTILHAQLHRTLRSRHLLPKHQRVLIAVSGGQDSLCLAKLLLDLQPKWGWQLAIAHGDHGWPQDAGMAAHVEAIARIWHLPFYLQTATSAIAQTEAAAREWRYQALIAIAQTYDYQIIVTGHTKSDRAETLLYNLIRGSGTDGLAALSWQRNLTENIQLVRPLLAVSRPETYQFCQKLNLPIWEDAYNQELKYARNRIRQELIPYLRDRFNPQVETALAQTAEILKTEVEYLEEVTRHWLKSSISCSESGITRLNRTILRQAPLAIQRRVLRQFVRDTIAIVPNFEQIEQLTALIVAPNRDRTSSFPQGFYAEVTDNWICFSQEGGREGEGEEGERKP